MSLRVWLPLNGTLDNQGLDTRQISQVGTGISITDGKIGKCFQFPNNCASYIHMPGFNLQTGSWAAWIKVLGEGAKPRQCLMSQGRDSYSDGVEIYTSQNGTTLYFKAHKIILSTSIELNRWYHIVGTFGDNLIKLYIDGVLVTSGTYIEDMTYEYSNNRFVLGKMAYNYTNTSNYFSFNGCLNDVRIYDHALSSLEVKQISQGLILHYPLNRNGWGQENLATCNTVQYNLAASTTNWNYFWITSNTALEPNTTYTFSAEVEVSDNQERCTIYNYTTSGKSGEINYYFPADGKRHSWTFTTTSNALGVIAYAGTAGSTANHSAIYKKIKLEKGSVATPWCPNSSDVLATTIGLNNNIEYDTSGYGNNGTRTGTFSWTSDTPKYQVSTIFDGTNYISTATPEADILTLSCWVKTSKNKSTPQIIVVDSTSQLCISFYSGTIITFYASSGYSTGSKCTLGSAYKENDWNHLVVVKTGTGTRKVYCNGIEQTATSNDYWSSSSTGFTVARRETSTPHAFYGELCDIRAYATALSADDVKSLYQNSAYIDNQGNIYGAVYEEV